MTPYARVVLKKRRARPFWFGHPWVFSGAIDRVKGRAADGDVVSLHDDTGKRIGFGFYNEQSQIRVRAVTFDHEGPPTQELMSQRLLQAIALREDVLCLPERTNAYRVVHAEGDGLPGLIVDRIGDSLVFQLSCLGMLPYLEGLLDILKERYAPRAIVERTSTVAREEEGLVREDAVISGAVTDEPVAVTEDGVRFFAHPLHGQKTGYYSDQRDNRRALAPLAKGKTVLDTFSYIGGFGLSMARAGASHVHFVESSAPALEMATLGAEANGVTDRVEMEKGNVLRVLDHLRQESRRFDVIIVDPPKFVHRRKDLEKGIRLYHEVNVKAVRILEPGGILITCSCSQHVTEPLFEEMLGAAAKESGTRFQEIYRGGQGPDHPILLPLEESRYLKCRAYRVWKSPESGKIEDSSEEREGTSPEDPGDDA